MNKEYRKKWFILMTIYYCVSIGFFAILILLGRLYFSGFDGRLSLFLAVVFLSILFYFDKLMCNKKRDLDFKYVKRLKI